MIDICLLGTGGGMPMPYRNLSATLINYKGRKILIDCGEGTQVSMRMISWGFKTVDVICITHAHGDHIVGLPGLLATIGNSGRIEPLTIVGPEGIRDIINSLLCIARYLPYKINIIEDSREIKLGYDKEAGLVLNGDDITISTMKCHHSAPCIAYSLYIKRMRKFNVEKAILNNVPKILWNKLQKEEKVIFNDKTYTSDLVLGDSRRGLKITLITDTRPMEEMGDFIKESDLFICEGTYGNDSDLEKALKNKHMTFREAGVLAKEGKAKALLLTHFSPAMLEPEEYRENTNFKDTIIGIDRLILNLKFNEE